MKIERLTSIGEIGISKDHYNNKFYVILHSPNTDCTPVSTRNYFWCQKYGGEQKYQVLLRLEIRGSRSNWIVLFYFVLFFPSIVWCCSLDGVENQEAYSGHRILKHVFKTASETIKWAFGYSHAEIQNLRAISLEIVFKALRVDKILPK